MNCRPGCGACCIAPSIVRPFYGMPGGKPAGVACVHLQQDYRCALFGDPRRPELCAQFLPEPSLCADSRAQALVNLRQLEQLSLPGERP